MSNYDDLLREKEKQDMFDDSSMEKHWETMEKKMDTNIPKPPARYRKTVLIILSAAAVLLVAFFTYTFFRGNKLIKKTDLIAGIKSAIIPPLKGLNVPYEIFSFDAAIGDTLFTLNGSIIIFPKNAVLNSKGEIVTGNIEVRTREFNDPFDYSIAGIPMDYDSAGIKYQFISSAMIDITAYQNGEPLQVNPAAKPQLNLVSTNKKIKTNLYILDTVTGKWINKGVDEVNQLGPEYASAAIYADVVDRGFRQGDSTTIEQGNGDATDFIDKPIESAIPAPPQKASNINPLINIMIDPQSFKELLVYDGLQFEVMDAKASQVAEDSKMDWDNIELIRGAVNGMYKVVFSAGNKKVTYNVKPVLQGKDFEAAEKLYQEKLKEYTRIQKDRKKDEKIIQKKNLEQLEENKRIEELNKLIAIRNKFIEAENLRIDALNKENQRRRDSVRVETEKQKVMWEEYSRRAALEQDLIRSFEIDGFGYWNCDQPTLPAAQQYIVSFKTEKNEAITYNSLCMAEEGINRIQNYYNTNRIGLINNGSYFGWTYNANQFYYFTRADFKNAARTNNPNTITITIKLYEGDLKNYKELKGFIFNVNSKNNIPIPRNV